MTSFWVSEIVKSCLSRRVSISTLSGRSIEKVKVVEAPDAKSSKSIGVYSLESLGLPVKTVLLSPNPLIVIFVWSRPSISVAS